MTGDWSSPPQKPERAPVHPINGVLKVGSGERGFDTPGKTRNEHECETVGIVSLCVTCLYSSTGWEAKEKLISTFAFRESA